MTVKAKEDRSMLQKTKDELENVRLELQKAKTIYSVEARSLQEKKEALLEAHKELDDIRIKALAATKDMREATTLAKLAMGTPDSKLANTNVVTAKKVVEDIEAVVKACEERVELCTKEEINSKRNFTDAHITVQKYTEEEDTLESLHNRLQNEDGLHIYQAHLKDYVEREKVIDELKDQLVALEATHSLRYQEAVQGLAQWPELREDLEALQPTDTPLGRFLEAVHYYLETIIADVGKIEQPRIPSLKTMNGYLPILDAIYIHPDLIPEYAKYGSNPKYPSQLYKIRNRVNTIREEYIASRTKGKSALSLPKE